VSHAKFVGQHDVYDVNWLMKSTKPVSAAY